MKNYLWLIVLFILLVGGVLYFRARNSNSLMSVVDDGEELKMELKGFKTNTAKKSVNLSDLLSGGPGRDGIPAINEPKFESIGEQEIDEEVLGMLVEIDGVRRYYPYNILVWHEVVNDEIGDSEFAVTFCPLCGSAIVYDRNVDNQILEFGVSGFLYESNMVMYDRQTESFWSQSRGESIVGDLTGSKLEILPFQLISFGELKDKYSDALVLSDDTGYNRDYDFYPYGNYDENEEIYFPVSIDDARLPAKEIMYVVPMGDYSLAIQQFSVKDGDSLKNIIRDKEVQIDRDGEVLSVLVDGEEKPGYFEMWFSWVTQHQANGEVWIIN